MYLSCIFTGAGSVSLTCSGCGSLSTDPRTYYYCPHVDKPIVLHCEITQLAGLVWTVPQLIHFTDPVTFSSFSDPPIVETHGFTTFILVSSEVGSFGSTDFSSIMTFNTKDIPYDEFTIGCHGGTGHPIITLKPLGMAIGLLFFW